MSDVSCEERIPAHLASRVADFAALTTAAEVHDAQSVRDAATTHHEALHALDVLPSDDFSDEDGYTDRTAEDMQERASEALDGYVLSVSSFTVFRVDISTGGPADWLEVFCSGDTPNYEPAGDGEHYEVDRIVYHFADWFDHAERKLDGDEFDAAERFVSRIVPELMA